MGYQTFSHVDEGVAIFSKLPILETSYLPLTRNFSDAEDEHQRVCLRALINTTRGPINFFVTHMSLSKSARRRNSIEIVNFANLHSRPQILVGDFNDEPESEMLHFLLGKLELDGAIGDWKDAWLHVHGPLKEKDGWTFTTLQQSPKKRIDFVLYRGDMQANDAKVVENSAHFATQPSDHRGLVVDFLLPFD